MLTVRKIKDDFSCYEKQLLLFYDRVQVAGIAILESQCQQFGPGQTCGHIFRC